jgi:HK97 family phage portal protein
MAWWSKFWERRAAPQWSLTDPRGWDDFGRGPTAAGVIVTPTNALQVPAVFACVSILSQDVAKTALKFRRRLGVDTFEDAVDHPLYELLGPLPNPETTGYDFKREMMLNLLRHERAYAEIVRVAGKVDSLWLLDPLRMRVTRDAQRRKVYTYTPSHGPTQTWTFDPSMPPILDLHHPSPIRQCPELIGAALALQTFVGKFFANGGRPTGVLQTAGRLGPDDAERLRANWTAIHGGTANSGKTAILEAGMSYSAIASANNDAQLDQLQQTLRTEIAAAFRVPVWRVGDMSNANYSNMEASERAYVSDALDPFFCCWEEAIRRDLLTVRQYTQFSVTFDRSSLIRSDSKTLAEALAVGRQNGWYSANDVRRRLGENPIAASAGGDAYLMNSALAPVPAKPTLQKVDQNAA